jgi:hypothetical protein
MTQGLIAGATDYSHQSFSDIVEDLENFSKMSREVCEYIEKTVDAMEEYWNKDIDYDLRGRLKYAFKFFQTMALETKEISEEIQILVREDHHKRLNKIGNKAEDVEAKLRNAWRSSRSTHDYQNKNFRLVERMYQEARSTADTLLDISNLASRLEDFVGKTASKSSRKLDNSGMADEFVSSSRINELKSIAPSDFDLLRLIRLLEEINVARSNGCFLTVAILTRAIIDHVPPIFGVANFNEIANNYKSSKSFKDSMNILNSSTRKIADSHLHTHIRNKESLPNFTQINCSQVLDVLLAEIFRILK